MRTLTLIALLLFSIKTGYTQTSEDAKKMFPDAPIILLKSNMDLHIEMKNGVPAAEGQHEVERLIVNSKTAELYNKYTIYHSGYSKLGKIEGYTLMPDGNRYKKLNADNFKTYNSPDKNVFYDDSQETSFDFEGLIQNAIAHVNYSQYYTDAHLLPTFYFRSFLPTASYSYSVTFPNDVELKYIIKNDDQKIIRFVEEKKRKETTYYFTATNVKDVEYYSDAPSSQYYTPQVIVYISSIKKPEGTEPFLNNLDDLYKWNYSFTKDLNKEVDPDLKKIVDSLTKNLITEKEKAKKIYHWVQENIKYIAFENGIEGFRPRQAAEVCSKRYGDCKDMSSIITQMLRIAGVKAYYTWIGTRLLPYDYTETPQPIVDNHMISTAYIDGNWTFLDGTDPNGVFAVPGSQLQGKEAMIAINDNEYKILRVPVVEGAKNLILDSTTFSITDNGIKGYESVYYNGYAGNDVYNILQYKDKDDIREYVKSRMSKGSNKFLLGNYNINKVDPLNNIININSFFELPEYGKKAGDEYYINLNLEKILENQLIDTAKRKVAKEIEYKYLIKQYHILQISDKYKVSFIPENFSFENDIYRLNITYQHTNKTITALQEIESKKLIVNVAEFEEWNKAIRAILPHYKEAIVLSQK